MRTLSFKKIGLLLIAVLLILSMNLYADSVRSSFFKISYPFQQVLWGAGDEFSSFLSNMFHSNQLRQNNEELMKENIMLTQSIAELDNIKKENIELRKVINTELPFEFSVLLANVSGREIGNDILLVNKGRESGIEVNMPVITAEKLIVGRVIEVLDGFSRVDMVSQEDLSFDAGVIGKDIAGVIRGEGGGNLIFDLIPQDKDLQEGDRVATSNLAKIFPENLIIGVVESIQRDDIEPFQSAKIKWLFDISATENVLIITNANIL